MRAISNISNGDLNDPYATTSFSNGRVVFSYPSFSRGRRDLEPTSKAMRRLLELQREIDELRRKSEEFGRHELARRIAKLEGERKLLSDQRSRARRPPAKTQRKTTQRLQTAQAAMDARFAAGCCR